MTGRLLIAHRGASARAPESTRAAIMQALACHVDMIELDVQLTADRRLVIFHDARLDRTTNGRGRLEQRRYRELARLDAGSWYHPSFSSERILLASQALRAVPPPCRINLELKRTPRPALLIQRLIRCVRWTRTLQRVLISSFDPRLIAEMARRQPRIPRAINCSRRAFAALRQAVRLACVAVHPERSLVTRRLVQRAHGAGLRLHVWTVDDPGEARRLIRLGVDGLFTNAPDRIGQAIHQTTRSVA